MCCEHIRNVSFAPEYCESLQLVLYTGLATLFGISSSILHCIVVHTQSSSANIRWNRKYKTDVTYVCVSNEVTQYLGMVFRSKSYSFVWSGSKRRIRVTNFARITTIFRLVYPFKLDYFRFFAGFLSFYIVCLLDCHWLIRGNFVHSMLERVVKTPSFWFGILCKGVDGDDSKVMYDDCKYHLN